MDLSHIEVELKQRWAYPYVWGRVQNDRFDAQTRFVYRIPQFETLLKQIERRFGGASDDERDAYFNYALNRWYNFWSARAIEEMCCTLDRVTPASNPRHRQVDFTIDGLPFDHKTSVFPQGFGRDLNYAVNHPAELIRWFYRRQSQQQRHHLANRLFLVLFAFNGQHWKLRAELGWLRTIVQDYVATFDAARLHRFDFGAGQETLADIIWAIRY